MTDFVFLSRHPLASQYTIEPYSRTGFVDIESGARRARPRFTFHPYRVSMRWLFTTAEYQQFRDWHTEVISQGADSFRMNLLMPDGFRDVTARFLAAYVVTYAGPGYFHVEMAVEVSDEMIVELSTYNTSTASNDDFDTVTSAAVTSTVTGGTGPYTYAWSKLSGDTFTLNSGASAPSQIFQTSRQYPEQTYTAIYRLVVTDYNGLTAYADVQVSHIWTEVPDPYWENVISLVTFLGANGDTSFPDAKGLVSWTRVGTPTISTDESFVGGSSGIFNGSTDGLVTPDNAIWHLSNQDFTIEAFVRFSSFFPDDTYFPGILSQRGNFTTQFGISLGFFGTGGRLFFYASSDGGSPAFDLTYINAFNVDTWYYIAVTRSVNTWKLWVDGVAVDEATSSISIHNSTANVRIGCFDDPPFNKSHFPGYLSQIRVTKGVARDVTTIPDRPFPTS